LNGHSAADGRGRASVSSGDDDLRLIARVRARDQGALEQLYRTYHPRRHDEPVEDKDAETRGSRDAGPDSQLGQQRATLHSVYLRRRRCPPFCWQRVQNPCRR